MPERATGNQIGGIVCFLLEVLNSALDGGVAKVAQAWGRGRELL